MISTKPGIKYIQDQYTAFHDTETYINEELL